MTAHITERPRLVAIRAGALFDGRYLLTGPCPAADDSAPGAALRLVVVATMPPGDAGPTTDDQRLDRARVCGQGSALVWPAEDRLNVHNGRPVDGFEITHPYADVLDRHDRDSMQPDRVGSVR